MPQTDGTSHGADESQCRDYGRIKGKGTDEMGRIDEQCPLCCGGDCAERVGALLMNSCWISRYICDKSRTGKEIYC